MECIEARALKSSFLMTQMGMKTTTSQMFQNDDVWGSVAPDDFPVEDLLNLDFPDKGLITFSQDDEDEDEQLPQKETSNYSSSTFSGADEIDSLSQLAVPVDDLDNLEWLSQFVDDSTTGLSLLCPPISGNREPQMIRAPYFHVPVPVKARSKRSRKSSGRSWSTSFDLWLRPSSSSSQAPYTLSPFVFLNPVHGPEWFTSVDKPAAKKQKRKPEADHQTGSVRKCMHCQVQKTPQWRTGPLGPKTLCNACGVRFKSGRLFPEYRPAFSPTFSLELHSNSHRKVLEMRRKKDVGEPGSVETVRDLGGVDQN